jgi:UDP:flavonoid glycosyltransferase YjiC (YdhE family)
MVEITRQRLKVPKIDSAIPVMAGLWSRCPIVLACAPEPFDFPSDRLPSNARYVGPILEGPMAFPWQRGGGTVLVSFSTTEMRQQDVLQRTLDALADVDVEVVCNPRAGFDRRPLAATQRVHLRLDTHPELLPRTDVVVTHAGLSTVMAALASGVPMVCMPMGRD